MKLQKVGLGMAGFWMLFGVIISISPRVQGATSSGVEEKLNELMIYEAMLEKTNRYFKEAVIRGGKPEVSGVSLKEIRRALNAQGYERIVFDFSMAKEEPGGASPVGMPSYYQVAISPERVAVTLRGIEQVGLTAKGLKRAFQKSRMVKSVNVYPALNSKEVVVEFLLRRRVPTEVFELHDPARVVLDLKVSR